MSGTERLDSAAKATDSPRDEISLDRRLWEAREEITELKGRLAEQLERERILELEIAAVRRDLKVKQEYAAALERSTEERQVYIDWLQTHFDIERARADAVADELRAERSRISYRLSQPLIVLLKGRRPSQ
jgi:hypothetical protein